MHMARLWDTSRDKISGGEGYSLEEVRVCVVYAICLSTLLLLLVIYTTV